MKKLSTREGNMVEKNKKNCKKTYEENQYCHHIPDKIKLRIYNMEEFTKYDGGKPKHSLLPPGIMNGVLGVMAFGANKYEKDNWKKCETMSSYYDACHRHLEQFWEGIDTDEESNLHHIDHALCNLVFLKWLIVNKEHTDDREPREVRGSKQIRKKEEGVLFFRRWQTLLRNKDN